jgi:hypothetical protein
LDYANKDIPMNDLLNYYNEHKAQVGLVLGLILGLLLGLLVGWVLWPRTMYNLSPELLRSDFRDNYMIWVAEAYAEDGDIEEAQERLGLEYWEGEEDESYSAVLQRLASGEVGSDTAILLMQLEQDLADAPAPAQQETPSGGGLSSSWMLCGTGLIVAGAVGLIWYLIGRIRTKRRGPSERAMASRQMEPAVWEEDVGAAPPISQFVTTYTLGDDFYDPSFSIENEGGDFMGECGVGISEAIGVGDPKKVTALEVWLFDKNDIRTVTKVLMSEYAFHDEALRARLASKGDQLLGQQGGEISLETATLTLRARILEMDYGAGELPAQSFFQRVTLELGIWIREEGGGFVESDLFGDSSM